MSGPLNIVDWTAIGTIDVIGAFYLFGDVDLTRYRRVAIVCTAVMLCVAFLAHLGLAERGWRAAALAFWWAIGDDDDWPGPRRLWRKLRERLAVAGRRSAPT